VPKRSLGHNYVPKCSLGTRSKIIFGSDYPLLPVSRYLKEIEEANLPEEWREMILGGNLAGLVGW
jgi:predicted TIM-barrel fold metal-dependent hydrolase